MAGSRAALRRRVVAALPLRGRTVVPAACGIVLLLTTPSWWRLTAGHGAPGVPFLVGLLLIGTLCVACEAWAIGMTRHQRPPDDAAAATDVRHARLAAAWHGLLELALDAVAAVVMVLGVVVVVVALVGLGVHAVVG